MGQRRLTVAVEHPELHIVDVKWMRERRCVLDLPYLDAVQRHANGVHYRTLVRNALYGIVLPGRLSAVDLLLR